jgi:hypothetical protein
MKICLDLQCFVLFDTSLTATKEMRATKIVTIDQAKLLRMRVASCDLATSVAVSNCVWLSAVASGMRMHSDHTGDGKFRCRAPMPAGKSLHLSEILVLAAPTTSTV